MTLAPRNLCPKRGSTLAPVLLSDHDIRDAIDSGHLGIDPFDAELIQPSSIDVRIDKFFRVFNNSKYTHIDPKQEMPDLTTLVEVPEGDASGQGAGLAALYGT